MTSSTSPSLELIGSVRSVNVVLFGDLRLAVRPNQWTCLLGSSGIGKSTILRLIAGLPTHVKLDGRIKSNDHLPISNRVSYMAQNDLLIPWATISDNVSLGNKLRGAKFSTEKKLKIVSFFSFLILSALVSVEYLTLKESLMSPGITLSTPVPALIFDT